MRAGFPSGGFTAGLIAAGSILGGCAESPSSPGRPPEQPAPYVRPVGVPNPPVGAIQLFNYIDYTLAIGNANTLLAIILGHQSRPFALQGNVFQTALNGNLIAGFPTDRNNFVVVSSGDARAIGAEAAYGICGPDVDFLVLCDVGGIDVPLSVPQGATTIEMDVRYFTMDYFGVVPPEQFEDPFRIFFIDGAVMTKVFQATVSSEFGVKPPPPAFQFAPMRRHLVFTAIPYRGRVILIRFVAGDQLDVIFPSGALIDNLMVR